MTEQKEQSTQRNIALLVNEESRCAGHVSRPSLGAGTGGFQDCAGGGRGGKRGRSFGREGCHRQRSDLVVKHRESFEGVQEQSQKLSTTELQPATDSVTGPK